jgi:RNA polymerase sigma-70 factor (ECF subfamily)
VQETILRAWKKKHQFQLGTNLLAWLFTILRNAFLSECRKRRWETEDINGVYAEKLPALPEQADRLEIQLLSVYKRVKGVR